MAVDPKDFKGLQVPDPADVDRRIQEKAPKS